MIAGRYAFFSSSRPLTSYHWTDRTDRSVIFLQRWGTMIVSVHEHLGYKIADSRHTRRTRAIDFSQVRLRGLYSMGGGEPYYAQLVVIIP